MKKSVRIPLVIQHLSFYILLLIIPVIIMGYIFHNSLLTNLKEQVTESNEQKLIQMKTMMDTKLSELHKISMQVSTQHELTPYFFNNFFDVFKAKQILDYKVGNDFIYEVFYYIRGDQYLFSSGSSYSLDSFINSYYQYQNWSHDDFYKDINESKQPFLRNAEEINTFNSELLHMITYVAPVPFNSKNPYGTLIFFIKEQMIKDMLNNVVSSQEGNAFILDQNGQAVATLFDRDSEISTISNEYQNEILNGGGTLTIEGKVYYLSSIKSDFLDWTFITISPESELMKEVNAVRNKVLLAYVIIFGAGILLIFLGMHLNYKPLHKLIHHAEEKWSRAVQNRHGLDKVWEAIHYSESRNQMLSERVENSRPVLQKHLLTRLLRGEIMDYDELNLLGEDLGLTFEESTYYVVLVEFHGDHTPPAQECAALVEGWMTQLPIMEKYQVELFEASKIAIILSGDVKVPLLSQWHQKFIKSNSFTTTIGVGNSYSEITQIGKSYLEASAALDYKLIKGVGQIIFFTETFADNLNLQWYDKKMVADLELFLRQRMKGEVELVMEQIIQIVKAPATSLFMAKCLIYDVSSTVMRVVHHMHNVNHKLEDDLPDILQINDFQSVEQLEETVKQLIQTVFALNEEGLSDYKLLEELLSYIRANYQDEQFSIQALASHFSLSEAYIMRYVKKQTGETVLQHLNRLRMSHTKELLIRTDLPVKDIALQVGYSDVSSFIRKFKQSEKLTPGEYRKQYANQNAD
ncbi:helix-turn-helix domain-containing protein [Paenibacillus sp. LHD-38]|uniref:helix-turn-helix domain-containing protein n=1 Tax=Paenibacillus sp. LHD-38 TaxID=3072143 RepID=UPI00280DECDC|nr:helix-turn-helix domain-containing protein [Paenibacillus sp. LHD-38]MDQ8737155.1 helix-turn-helix domain-containing protein [Paenibacillus sp. LHD-38]